MESDSTPAAGPQRQPNPRSLSALAYAIGRATAREGLDLDTAVERLRLVESRASPVDRPRFNSAVLAVALTNGWTSGALARDVEISLAALRRDVHEQYRRCLELGLDPAEELALVVFRCMVESRSDTMPTAVTVLRALAHVEFPGESVAVAYDKLLVLAHRTPDLAPRARALAERMSKAVGHVGMSAGYWIEPLSSRSTWLDEHLGWWWR